MEVLAEFVIFAEAIGSFKNTSNPPYPFNANFPKKVG